MFPLIMPFFCRSWIRYAYLSFLIFYHALFAWLANFENGFNERNYKRVPIISITSVALVVLTHSDLNTRSVLTKWKLNCNMFKLIFVPLFWKKKDQFYSWRTKILTLLNVFLSFIILFINLYSSCFSRETTCLVSRTKSPPPSKRPPLAWDVFGHATLFSVPNRESCARELAIPVAQR